MKTWVVLAGLTSFAIPALAQQTGAVAGTVLVASTGQPIGGAAVVLEAASDVAVVSTNAGPFLGRSFTAITDASGSYRFAGLQPGSYRLLVRHLGFHPATIQVDLAQATAFRVSVALVVNPIRLEPLDARAMTTEPYGRTRTTGDEARFGRLDAEQYRDQAFLEGDAAVLTHQDVTEAVTLGETDLFRALQRLPGVSTRDDFTASLWTRGAPWSQTRVYFDGLPLFNPVHAIGVLSGLNPDAVGVASFHPGARTSAIGEGAAGVLNVTSRRAPRPGVRGLAELSVASVRASVDGASSSGRLGGMLAVRRSYVDLVTRLAQSLGGDSNSYIPYDFIDVSARVDARISQSVSLEASGLLEEDGVRGDIPNLLRRTRGRWGNRLGRVSLLAPIGPLQTRHTAGVSRFSGVVRPFTPLGSVSDSLPEHGPMTNGLTVLSLSQDVSPRSDASRPPWSAGLQLTHHSQNYSGQYPRPYPVKVLPDTLQLNDRLTVVALWAERRFGLGRHAALDLGLRLESHDPVRNATGFGVAPRITLRATPPGSPVTLTASVARSFQYTQALAPAGPSVGPDLYVTDVWFLAGDTIPAVRADIATLGAEAWLGRGWTASVNIFGRHATGVAVPEPSPSPGGLYNGRAIFVASENRAAGFEAGIRRLLGRVTASASYSYGGSVIRAVSGDDGNWYQYPSTADRRHAVDLAAMARLGSSWRIGGTFTVATGAPFSRFVLDAAECDTLVPCDTVASSIEMPNAERAPGYRSLDLVVDWSRNMGRVRLGAFLQIRNALNFRNAVTYTGTLERCTTPNPPYLVRVRANVCDRFDKGLPILPLGGIRIAF